VASTAAWRRVIGSVRVRITVLATLVFAIAFTAASFLLVNSVRGSLENAVRADNKMFLSTVASQVAAGAPADDVVAPNSSGSFQIIDDGVVVAGNGGLAYQAPLAGVVTEKSLSGRAVSVRGPVQDSIVGIKSVDTPAGKKFTVAVASPLDGVRRSVDTVVRDLKIGVPVLILAVGALVWLLVRRALRPVEAIREEVEVISHGTLHRRVPVAPANDEVARLAGTMNDMLDRLEGAASRQRVFVSDASHELRSPLATSRTLLEVSQPDAGALDWVALRAQLLAENRRMEELVDGLLELARADDASPATAGRVEIADVVAEEVSRRRPVEMRVSEIADVVVVGHADQLARALRNLLDNAERHAASRVHVSMRETENVVELAVDDDGPGVPPADRERVFERFTRLEEGRSRDDGGSGLGLAIVAAIAARHGGSVRVGDSHLGGARFTLRLPRARIDNDVASPVLARH
jgi:signal transduction histidine kinase